MVHRRMSDEGPSALTQHVNRELQRLRDQDQSPAQLNASLRLLAKWRCKLLENFVLSKTGTIVPTGPFAGLDYDVNASEGGRIPRLLGCYETTLHPVLETIIKNEPRLVIDVGCAEGLYAVGLARRLPRTIVWARDENPKAQNACAHLANLNNVASRIKIGGKLTHADFDICRAQPTTIICDIEGGEDALMDPARAKGLARADILVEVHEGIVPGLTDRLIARFENTHDIQRLDRAFSSDSLPPWAEDLSDLDRLLLLWEWRSAPTPWLWMTSRFH